MKPRYILDEHGKPQPCDDLLVWGRWFEDSRNRIVAQTNIGDYMVSTIFLGFDHNFGKRGAPVLWETMIFGKAKDKDGEPDILDLQWRYSSREEAVGGHTLACQLVKDKLP